MNDKRYAGLFICAGNSACSIMAEVILSHVGKDRFNAFKITQSKIASRIRLMLCLPIEKLDCMSLQTKLRVPRRHATIHSESD